MLPCRRVFLWELLLHPSCLARFHGVAACCSAAVSTGTTACNGSGVLSTHEPSACTRTSRTCRHIAGGNHNSNPIGDDRCRGRWTGMRIAVAVRLAAATTMSRQATIEGRGATRLSFFIAGRGVLFRRNCCRPPRWRARGRSCRSNYLGFCSRYRLHWSRPRYCQSDNNSRGTTPNECGLGSGDGLRRRFRYGSLDGCLGCRDRGCQCTGHTYNKSVSNHLSCLAEYVTYSQYPDTRSQECNNHPPAQMGNSLHPTDTCQFLRHSLPR